MFATTSPLRTCLSRNARAGALSSRPALGFAVPSFFSTFAPRTGQQLPRAYPSYSVASQGHIFSMKLLTPKFEITRNTLTLPPRSRGRLLLEWTPRDNEGRIIQDQEAKMSFALSAEEAGLVLDQLPENPVEIRRAPQQNPMLTQDPDAVDANQPPQQIDKVCRITPKEAGLVEFKCDFELDGVGAQRPAYGDKSAQGPMAVSVQAGEFQVMREIMRTSLPMLVGWQTMVGLSLENFYNMAQLNRQDQPYGGGGSGYNTGGNSNNNGNNFPYQ